MALASLVSEGYSIFTAVSSILPSVASAASAAASSSSASVASVASAASNSAASNSATTTGSSSFVTSTSASSASPSTSASATSSNSSAAAAAASASASSASTTAGNSHNGGGHNNLAIILGSVLGALALGLLLLALILCCRRRRRRSRDSLQSHGKHLSNEEFDSWRQPKTGHHHGTHHNHHNKEVLGTGAVAAPLMAEHPAYRDEHGHHHQNPFVPVPPPPRRSAQNYRNGLTDGAVQGDHPYLIDEKTGQPLDHKSGNSHHAAGALAAGVGGAAIGAAALHHHNKNQDHELHDKHAYDHHGSAANRSSMTDHRSGDSHHAAGALAAGAGGTALGAAALHHHNKNKDHELHERHAYDHGSTVNHSSITNRKPVPMAAAAPIGHNPNIYPTPSTNDDAYALNKPRRASMDGSRTRPSRDANRANEVFNRQYSSSSDERHHNHHMGGTVAALGAGAVGGAALAHHHGKKSKPHSRSPHRNTFPPTRHHQDDNSDSSNYADALPEQLHNVPIVHPVQPHHEPAITGAVNTLPHSTDAYDIPPPLQTRSRRNSAGLALGAGAPAAAAAAAYPTGRRPHSHSRSRSGSRSASLEHQTHPHPDHRDNDFNVPVVPSRSPHRNSGSPSPHRPGFITTPTSTTPPLRHSGGGAFPIGGVPGDFEQRVGVVGNNGYPHMNLPRRKSAGADDYNAVGAENPFVPHDNDRDMSGEAERGWRLSEGMPGGWQQTHAPATRYSGDLNRANNPISPVHNDHISSERVWHQRDSAMSGSTAVGASGGKTRHGGLRTEEDQMGLMQGRESMASEWVGNGGYDGYQGHHGGHGHGGHQGVGQAM